MPSAPVPTLALGSLLALAAPAVAGATTPPGFADATRESGLDFTYFNGATGEYFMVENMGGGGALLDYDGDGDLDLYLVQGDTVDGLEDTLFPPPDGGVPSDRLLRNDLAVTSDGRRVAHFVDVTEQAGIPAGGYGMGAATGDYDGDGRVDLYVTAWGPNRLLRNRGDGTFEDTTRAAGVEDERWSVPASFADLDGDGDLDLYVGNYLAYTLEGHKPCLNPAGGRDYCSPAAYEPVPGRLFGNRGDGTFEDLTSEAGLDLPGKALGAVAADLDGDGRLDLYVANDQMPNRLWLDRREAGRPSFADEALLAGCAVNGRGEAEASMGLVAEDLDGDGDLDLFATHLDGETHTLYENLGGGTFRDATPGSGIAGPSLGVTGFGVVALDADGDGRPDLLVANGAVRTLPERVQQGDPYPLDQPDHLFLNLSRPGEPLFEEVSARAGEPFDRVGVGRGVIGGDVDGDGDTDAVVVESAGPARLLLNRLRGGRASESDGWVAVEAVGPTGAPALGAEVEISAGGRSVLRRVASDGGYASASDPRVRAELGAAARQQRDGVRVRLRWPDGTLEAWEDLPTGRYLRVVRAAGEER